MEIGNLSIESMLKLFWRISAFIFCLLLVVIDEQGLTNFLRSQLVGIDFYKWLWLGIVLWFITAMLPRKNEKMASGKRWRKNFTKGEIKLELIRTLALESTKKVYKSQWLYLILLFGFYFIFIILRLSFWWAIVFTLWAGVVDAWCMTIWCPYRNWLVKNKCCNNCRIFNWGYLMATLPLLAVPSFWTYSIVALALAIFIQWEFLHLKFPERFYEISNRSLQCINCPGKTGYCRKNRKNN